ncbi:DNA-binding response regulator, NarL/FixJ family, contains REC and HTH domains [Parapedobacter composti]|uniref:DNA-binding response regulator, NarL/FixJ family, contains REC and HTH domains n=1 Tax=Parapedobacter composti TaxID=623281 RepID=A0A1I1L639_9SPHI|nr:response regulator transcription factor [Parapedobacter composti]SFC68524.1 DNA-binding response regulator, NarL/FixJ family, contains REC and HTH domains [Parapedobacter composti]
MIKVAIVDDHKILTEGLQGLIAESGIATVAGVAHSAAACRLSIGFWKPDVVLLDVGLPDGSGIDLCKELKTQVPGMKILALTTHNEYTVVRQMLDNGASGYLIKNAMADEVLAGIQAVAAGETFLCHEIDLLMKRPQEKNIWLSPRERELLRLVTEGLTNAEIAEKIFLSPETIKGYRKNLLLKLGARNTAVLVKMALEQKLI